MSDNIKIFKYRYTNCYYYGQGFDNDEQYVRIALESKLNLPHNTLNIGTNNLHPNEIKKVTLAKVNLYDLKNNIPELRSINSFDTINDIISRIPYVKNNVDRFYTQICDIYNIPYHYMRVIDKDYTINDVINLSNYKIIVKTHKIIKDSATGKSNIISRVEELKNQIKRLINLDYSLFFEVNDFSGEYERVLSTYNKALESKDSNAKIQSILNTHPGKLSEIKDILFQSENKLHNTGFYINNDNKYYHNSFEDIIKEFDELYEKIRAKIIRYSYSDIPMNDKNSDITMLDTIDSYVLVSRQNNNHIK